MRERAFASIDAEAAEAIVKFKSPEGRQNTRIALAKALRNDPDFMAQVQELRDLEAQRRQPIDDYTALLEQEAGPPSSSGAGTILGVAAAGAAAFMIAR
jgi:ferric-dicitrate binding protein FerR (iron transport regulator)